MTHVPNAGSFFDMLEDAEIRLLCARCRETAREYDRMDRPISRLPIERLSLGHLCETCGGKSAR